MSPIALRHTTRTCCFRMYGQRTWLSSMRRWRGLNSRRRISMESPTRFAVRAGLCNPASASSIPIAKQITERFQDPAEVEDIGQLHLNMSGCVNACGHHHTGHIGILGVDRGARNATRSRSVAIPPTRTTAGLRNCRSIGDRR